MCLNSGNFSNYFETEIILIYKLVSLFIYLLTLFLDLNLEVDVCFVSFMNVDIIYNNIIMKEPKIRTLCMFLLYFFNFPHQIRTILTTKSLLERPQHVKTE